MTLLVCLHQKPNTKPMVVCKEKDCFEMTKPGTTLRNDCPAREKFHRIREGQSGHRPINRASSAGWGPLQIPKASMGGGLADVVTSRPLSSESCPSFPVPWVLLNFGSECHF